MNTKTDHRFTPAVTAILLFGIISLLGDMIYETARSANSQYLQLLSISAAQVGLVFGIGEFLGYGLRLMAGILSDQSGRYWHFLFLGYSMLLAVPLIGFTMNWPILIILILLERIGKALRNPAKDTILSGVAEHQIGIGFAFGLQEALDQIGALTGPLLFTIIFYFTGKNGIAQYQLGYQILLIPFVLLMVFLVYAQQRIKQERLIPDLIKKDYHAEPLKPVFWIYTAFTFFCTLGFVNFSLIGYHLKAQGLIPDGTITLLYATAMLADALTALTVGKLYDQLKKRNGKRTGGLFVLMAIPFFSLFLPFLTLSNSISLITIGMISFGIVLGIHETVMRSAIADLTPYHKRGTGYGVFSTSYGLALLGGASLMGLLYDQNNIVLITVFVLLAELTSVLLYFKMNALVKTSHLSKG